MNNIFIPLHIKNRNIEFILTHIKGTSIYTSAVTAPVDFVVDFEIVNGEFVKKSDNDSFYDSLIQTVKAALPRNILVRA